MSQSKRVIAIVGAGPAGLMAADILSKDGKLVHVFDAMPSAGRKFLLAGKSGMNLSHAEDMTRFLTRYPKSSDQLRYALSKFDCQAIRGWALDLGIETFVGSSGRVFPSDMKAAPLLRAWIQRLRNQSVIFHMRHKWVGVEGEDLIFENAGKMTRQSFSAIVFAMGGASWKRLGSDATWVSTFTNLGVSISPFEPSNCGFSVDWSSHFSEKFAGTPLTNVRARLDEEDNLDTRQGQFVITKRGVEGSLIYALSSEIRRHIHHNGYVNLYLDLTPGKSCDRVYNEVKASRGSKSISAHLRGKLGLHPIHVGLLYETLGKEAMMDHEILARAIKKMKITLQEPFPIDEAISSAGGVSFESVDDQMMLKLKPGWFCAGEMLDWDAPTGGYLLSACFATGVAAARGVEKWLFDK
ncbi:TIGR03862 family flavoprotein [Undibacterium fentianense]|uniref:TIGR03862 family flavoprotein n=1 Tax=Undibacterium fentianense TaxID=2828728 RepID=A0A941IIC4_9BURK|nr:TIGR03862 family flavoprotein [Undibacterium fentianense]MBR7801810.1 TIGR03862 family flavoprotein [Undibacterium fentianense]